MGRFTGKNILVVGGSSGIGLEPARRLLAGGAGLTIWSRREPAGLEPGRCTRSLAAEFAPKAIRFNALAPSLTDTPLAAELLSTEERRAKAAERNSLGRLGAPADAAAAAEFLLSDEAAWITGQVLAVDGGDSRLRLR